MKLIFYALIFFLAPIAESDDYFDSANLKIDGLPWHVFWIVRPG